MLTINAIRQTARGTPIWQPGAINLHVSVPCPLKVRLKEALGAFITDYNQRHERPLFCPSILDGIPHGTKKDTHSHQMLKRPYSRFHQAYSKRNRFICT